ncbi:MAG: hypothetical protein HYZ10_11125 [Ignavibacteriales bacterium]|nr:hypothetical protein [Ignavibacteriales bacterium]
MKFYKSLLFLLLIVTVIGCKKDSPTEAEDNSKQETVIAEAAKPVDDELRSNLKILDTTSFSMQIPSSLVTSKKIKINDVLVDKPSTAARFGFLRKITSIQQNGDQSTITTSQGTLKDVIEKGSISIKKYSLGKHNLASIQLINGAKLANSPALNKANLIGINWDYEKDIYSSGSNKVTVKGNAAFNFDLNFDLTINLLNLEYFKTSLEVNQAVSMNFKANFSKDLANVKIPFAKAFFNPITFSVGIIPVVLVPEITLYLGADGSISANTETWFKESFTGEYGIKYTEGKGWSTINADNFTLEKELPKIAGAGKFSAYVGPQASIKLYGVAGPYLTFDAYTEIDSKLNNTKLVYDYYIGFRCNAGVQVELFGWELLNTYREVFSKELFHYNSKGENADDSFRLTNPTNDQTFVVGDFINLTTFYNGTRPSSVKFYVDGVEKFNDPFEPFEYTLSSTSMSEGEHTIKAVAAYSVKTLESSAKIKLQKPVWTKIDMSGVLSSSDIIHRIYFVNENLGFAVGGGINHSLILKTNDGGNTWTKVLSKSTYDDRAITDIVYVNSSELYAIRIDNLFKSTNNGSSWEIFEPQGEINSRVGGTKLSLSSEGLIIGGYSSFYLKIASTSGDKWVETYAGGADNTEMYIGEPLAVKYLNNKKLVVLDGKDLNSVSSPRPHQVLISNDGGYNWKNVSLNIPFEWEPRDMSFGDENNGWIVGHCTTNDRGFVLKTTNGGESWSVLHNPNNEKYFSLNAVYFLDFQNGFAGGTLVDLTQGQISWNQGVLSSNNSGVNWANTSLKNYNQNGTIRTLFFLSKTKGWAAGSHQTLYKYSSN